MGFGQGAAGTNGNGIQLLAAIFMELFGGAYSISICSYILTWVVALVSLGQLVGAISPNIQVRHTGVSSTQAIAYDILLDCGSLQPLLGLDSQHVLWCDNPIRDYDRVLAVVAVPTRSFHAYAERHAWYRTPVSNKISLKGITHMR